MTIPVNLSDAELVAIQEQEIGELGERVAMMDGHLAAMIEAFAHLQAANLMDQDATVAAPEDGHAHARASRVGVTVLPCVRPASPSGGASCRPSRRGLL